MQVKIVIFGFTGDLSKRKLIPALQNIDKVHSIKQIIGVSRREINAQEIINGSIGEKNSLAKKTTSVVLDSELAQYKKFKTDLNLQDDEQLLIFLSVPPNALEGYVTLLAKAGLNGKNVKLLIEKPFGTDYNSAVKMFHILNKYYNPKNVYKIDHYLLKTPAQKFNNFCLLNPKLTKVLNAKNISQVDVVAYEEIDIQGRKEFYEQVGCTRDFIQGHLLEILSVFLAKPVRKNILNSRVKANSLIKPLRNINNVKIGKYQGYDEENNVTSSAETYANFLLFSGDKK
jgi:glucose-6-phosphate 1-dehydrogenase